MTALKLPYFFAGSNTGCLLLHGFSSTPAELRVIGEALAQSNYTTKGILLAGHGTKPEDLLGVTYENWIDSAQEGINELKKSCNRIVVIGHSMGGLLALQMAARNKISAVITIAAALKPTNRKIKIAWLLKHFQKYTSFHQVSTSGKYLIPILFSRSAFFVPFKTIPKDFGSQVIDYSNGR